MSDMAKLPLVKTVVGAGLATLAVSLGAGVAAAAPDTSVLVNTTCTYEQVVAALNAEQPAAAAEFNASPLAQNLVSQFIASGPVERQNMVDTALSSSMISEYVDPIMQVAGVCNNY